MQGIFDTGLFLFHFCFCCRADIDDGNAADQFCQPFFEFLFVVVGDGWIGQFCLDLSYPLFDSGRIAGAIDDGCVFFRHFYCFGVA